MVNRWRPRNEAIFHESEILQEKQYTIGNFRSGQDYVIQVFLKRTTFSENICLQMFDNTMLRLWHSLRRRLGGTMMYSKGETGSGINWSMWSFNRVSKKLFSYTSCICNNIHILAWIFQFFQHFPTLFINWNSRPPDGSSLQLQLGPQQTARVAQDQIQDRTKGQLRIL